MKKLYILISILFFSLSYSQSARNLDDTKSYIVRMVNEYGWEKRSNPRRLQAKFEGDLLRIFPMNKDYTEPLNNGLVYNFANIYKFKGPIKEPGEIAILIIWLDFLSDEKNNQWKKESLEIEVHNYEVAEQLMLAFNHLNKLLLEKKPPIEKF